MATLFVILIFAFFAIISIVFFIGWRSFQDSSVLGGVVLIWLTLIIFLLIILLGGRNRSAANTIKIKLVFSEIENVLQ